jgi:hypothetical protein
MLPRLHSAGRALGGNPTCFGLTAANNRGWEDPNLSTSAHPPQLHRRPNAVTGVFARTIIECLARMPDLTGRAIAITDATSGMGQATASWLASLNASVSLTDSNRAGLDRNVAATHTEIGDENVFSRVADMRNRNAVDSWIQDSVDAIGDLDAAVNAAGAHSKCSGSAPIWDMADGNWGFAQDVNVGGMLNTLRAQLKNMVSAVAADRKTTALSS